MHQNQRVHTLKSPDGVKYSFHDLTKFAAQHGIGMNRLSLLVNGHIKHTRGWTLAGEPNKLKRKPKPIPRPPASKENQLLNLVLTV